MMELINSPVADGEARKAELRSQLKAMSGGLYRLAGRVLADRPAAEEELKAHTLTCKALEAHRRDSYLPRIRRQQTRDRRRGEEYGRGFNWSL